MSIEVKMMPLDQIELDLENPRIARLLSMYKEVTSDQIALALSTGESEEGETFSSYRNLKSSIKSNEGIIHPIIVNRLLDGRMIAIEGNTRLQIYREFLADEPSEKWEQIPCIIHENLPRYTIDAIRLQAHLVGPRPWDPYSKAKYLNMLSTVEYMTIDRIIEFCGGKRREILNYISAYKDMEDHYRPLLADPDGDFDPKQFSAFVELQKPRIKSSVINNRYTIKDFSKWVIENKFSPLNTVRSLPEILANAKAKDSFLRDGGDAEQAKTILFQNIANGSDISNLTLIELSQEVTKRLGGISFKDVKDMKRDEADPTRQSLSELHWQLEEIIKDIMDEIDA
jgi:hypothetical protein